MKVLSAKTKLFSLHVQAKSLAESCGNAIEKEQLLAIAENYIRQFNKL